MAVVDPSPLVSAASAPSAYARRTRVVLRVAAALGVVILVGCSSDDKGESADADTTLLPLFDGGGGSIDAGGSDTADADETKVGCPGASGCPCTDNASCDSALCLSWPAGKRCAALCDGSGCEAGETCAQVPTAGGDTISACVPNFATLCDPCKVDKDCASPGSTGARCVHWGAEGAFCGASCASDEDCPAGYGCSESSSVKGEAVKQCRPSEGALCACSAIAIQNELSTVCAVKGIGDASCPGLRACLAAGKSDAPPGGGLTACLGKAPGPEACDGVDNDCDGATDNDLDDCDDKDPCTIDTCDSSLGCVYLPSTKPCDDGDACTEKDACATVAGKLGCHGKPIACDDGNPCTNDGCDVDLGCTATPTGAGCDDGDPCTSGDACSDTGSGVGCAGVAKICDDGDPCTADSCDGKTGACATAPVSADGGAQVSCDDGDACTAGDVCGALDGGGFGCKSGVANACDDGNACTIDSCDPGTGCVQNADAGKTEVCYSGPDGTGGKGTCKAGLATCGADGSLGACVGEVVPSAKEACDELDDDCDGDTDEGCNDDKGPLQVQWRFGGTTISAASAGGTSLRAFVGGSGAAGVWKGSANTAVGVGFYQSLRTWWK